MVVARAATARLAALPLAALPLAALSWLILLAAWAIPGMADAAAPPRYAAFMVDANTREVLYANAPDELRHPASLTKMMTLYLVFDALESGRLKISDPVFVSRHAASMKPSRLGLAVGESISVDNAISVVAVKSANDIAVALAEKLGGTEPNFVAMMNAKAAMLGMRNTHYANASGLTDPTNVTSARDLAILSLALVHDHPRFYSYFGERDFVFARSTMINHNHLLGKLAGVDGIKTGYTVDSGFTVAASAQRGNRRLIAVVLGEPSLIARNRDATALLDAGFSVLDRRGLGQAVTVASVLPSLDHPALRVEPAIEQGAADENAVVQAAPVRQASRGRSAHGRVHGRIAATGTSSRHARGGKKASRATHAAKSRSTAKTSAAKSTHRHHR
ncbi:D-alanyl-D-alanine carboxypeptidase family protein [Sphingomonas abietis]|uniref:D-alanyl-D-alanine carboxypeptidase n=1 Tax=Sphingomonas abietis TaxID=3012344 RepID=A0ABY7NPF8_9SPHN|nr:D-alanyl-D-alanine carboxypeptidase family protein [Sphingomonas abietis]WBO23424.1 D-alanyl-D-alanine carboxypeptidase [Sphingomonas abietis]